MSRYHYTVIVLLSLIVVLLVVLICLSFESRKSSKCPNELSGSREASNDSLTTKQITAMKEMKERMLLAEMAQRSNSSVGRSNTVNQYRLLIPTLIIAVLGIVFAKNGLSEKLPNSLVPILLIGISFSGYWWDCYIADLQSRVDQRVKCIKETLIRLSTLDPSHDGAEITEIKIHKGPLEGTEGFKKICLLLQWRFEHSFFWCPLFVLGLWLLFKMRA